MKAPALFAALRDGYILERLQAVLFPIPAKATEEIRQLALSLFLAFRLRGVCKMQLEVFRGEIRMKQTCEFFLPVPLVELLLRRGGRLRPTTATGSLADCEIDGINIYVEIFTAIVALFSIYRLHVCSTPRGFLWSLS